MAYTTFELKGKRGIDDLLKLDAFTWQSHWNNGQDRYSFNSLKNYEEHICANDGTITINFPKDCITSDKAILNERNRRKQYNGEYIHQLLSENKFGEEYVIYKLQMEEHVFFNKITEFIEPTYRYEIIEYGGDKK